MHKQTGCVKIGLSFLLLVATAASLVGQEPDSHAKDSPLWCKHTILVYVNPSGAYLDLWTTENLKRLAAYCDAQGRPQDLFFDGFLLIGFGCKGGRHLLPLADRKPALMSDWQDTIRNYLTVMERLGDAFEEVAGALNKPEAKGKVILAMPHPDPRQRSFGPVNGGSLDLSNDPDRVRAMAWYIDESIRQWQEREKRGALKRVALVGFYWGHEAIGEADVEVVKGTAAHVHEMGLLLHWIPCYGGGRKDWKEIGLDCVTQQINYQNPQKPGRPLTIFDVITGRVAKDGMHGVEMTPMARTTDLNPRVWSWHQVHLANLEAALRLKWNEFPAMTYFHGGDLPQIAADPQTRVFYDDLYKWVKGTLTQQDVEALAAATLAEQKRAGVINDEWYAKIAAAKTVLEKLQLMEEPKLEALRKAEAERLAPLTQSSGNLLKDGSFERGLEDWPRRSGDVARSQETSADGGWSLRLSLEPGAGSEMIRAFAKSVRVPVRPGQAVRLRARVRLPQDLQETQRGLMIGLSRFQEGKCLATWTECEIGRVEATADGWQCLTLHLFVDDKPCDEVEAIIGACGVGAAYVDDVELVTLSRP
ncbi:MAG: DUF4855 domain-containing protein [Planctomycetota bacterium]